MLLYYIHVILYLFYNRHYELNCDLTNIVIYVFICSNRRVNSTAELATAANSFNTTKDIYRQI